MSAIIIVEALLKDAAIDTLVGGRTALEQLKQRPAYPALVYNFPTERPNRNLAAAKPERVETTVQINPLAQTIDQVIAIHAAVRSVFEMNGGIVAGQTVISIKRSLVSGWDKDNELGLWTRGVDYTIEHYE